MNHYHIFGGVLRSEVAFPELIPADASSTPRWTLSRVSSAPALPDLEIIGTEAVEADVSVTLAAGDKRLRLVFDDTGVFDVSADGHRIEWAPRGTPDLEAVRKDVLGRVLALCLHQEGILSLHGSAVALHQEAVAFVAPKFHGKSTTAMALVETGARLLADDLVALSPGSEPRVLPSVPFVQLWRDSAAHVATSHGNLLGDPLAPKVRIGWDWSTGRATDSSKLAAVYVLAPSPESAGGTVRRERLPAVHAALALLGQAKIVGLLGGAWRASLLHKMADLADRISVYRLEVPRDLGRISELTSSLWAWHTTSGQDGPVAPPP